MRRSTRDVHYSGPVMLLAAACLLSACAHPATKSESNPQLKPDEQIGFLIPPISNRDGMEIRGLTMEEADRHNAAVFARQNAPFRVPDENESSFGRIRFENPGKRQTLLQTSALRLELKLGAFYSGSGGMRTHSRYRVMSGSRVLSEAESILCNELDWAEVTCFAASDTTALLLMEVRQGTAPRFILFTSERESWRVRYVVVPVRETPSYSPMHWSLPNIMGLRDGQLFLKEDGVTYAYPLDSLDEVPELEFGVG